jgi:nitroreductase
MEFNELLEKRRSVRKFQETQVPEDLIEKIIDDATQAPNAGNLQPWQFIVITDKKLIRKMSDDSKTSILADINQNPDSAFKIYKNPLQNQNFNVFYNAPCLICIVGRAEIPTIAVDCALAASYLMLSAASRELGTCWVELGKQIRDPDLLQAIKLPAGHQIHAPIIVGYPVSIPKIPQRKKPKIIYL